MTFLRASIALIGTTASAKEASGSNTRSTAKLRGPPKAQAQQGGGRDRELLFDSDGGLDGLFGDGGVAGLEELFGAFGGGGTSGLAGGGAGLSEVLGDAVDGLADAFGVTSGNSVLTQIFGSFAEAVDGLADTLQEGMSEWNFTVLDWGDGAVWSGTEAASGASVLGQVAGSFACPPTCANEGLCATVFTGMAGPAVLEEACNAGCLPSPASCADVCGTAADGSADGLLRPLAPPTAVTRLIDLGAVKNLACDSCKFLACCGADPAPDGDDAPSAKFASCQEHLPDGNALWADVANVANVGVGAGDVQGFVAEIAEGLGLSFAFDGDLPSLLGEALAEFDAFPAACDRDSCPVDGLCDASVLDLAALDFDDLCAKDAFFGCSEGLKGTCEDECGVDGDGDDGDDLKSEAPFCTLCGVAACCAASEAQGTTFLDCALGALPKDLAGLLGGAASALGGAPTKTSNDDGAPVAATEDGPAAEATEDSPGAEAASGGGSANAAPAAEVSRIEEVPGDGDGGIIVAAAASATDFEASRVKVQDSASCRLGTAAAACLALASVAALFLTSS